MDNVPVAPGRDNRRDPASNHLLESAISYAAKGWLILPLHTPTAVGCSCLKSACKSVGKHPRNHNGLKGASADAGTIRRWWSSWPDANIGIATGPGSRIFVLDVDGPDGQAALKALGQLPQTLRVKTGRKAANGARKGFHLYFNCPACLNLRSNAGLLGKGLDIRANGGYVVAPPSRHTSGLRYEWAAAESAIADAPAWLLEMGSKAIGDSAKTDETAFIYEGERNNRLFRLAANWRRQGADEDILATRLRGHNRRFCRPPLDEGEVLKIAENAISQVSAGSLDPLDSAWKKVESENHWYAYNKLLALIRHLASGPGCTILLPLVRIGTLIGCDWTLVRRHRKRAIAEGYIQEVERYIPHQKATRFKVIFIPQ